MKKLDEIVNNGEEWVFVNFTADYCADCRRMDIIYKELEERMSYKTNVSFHTYPANGDTFADFKKQKVKEYPTLILYQQGKEFTRLQGFHSLDRIFHHLKKTGLMV